MHFLLVVAGSTAAIYVFLVVLIRIFGKHTTAQLSAIDLVIIMLLGSSVETSMVNGSSLLRAGFVSAALLIALNAFRNVVCGGPTILVNKGTFVDEHLKRVGLTHADVLEALREREFGDLAEIRLAVLEADGTVNVIPESKPGAEEESQS